MEEADEITEGKFSVQGSGCQGAVLGCWGPTPPSSSMTHCVPVKPRTEQAHEILGPMLQRASVSRTWVFLSTHQQSLRSGS